MNYSVKLYIASLQHSFYNVKYFLNITCELLQITHKFALIAF